MVSSLAKLIYKRIRKGYLFWTLTIVIIISVLCFFHTHHQRVILRDALSSRDTLLQIWVIQTSIATIAVTIMAVSLSQIDKKLYGIKLSKIITMSNFFIVKLIILFFFIVSTFIPVVGKTMIFKNVSMTALLYLLSSLCAFSFIIDTMYALAYPEEEYEEVVKNFYRKKIVSKKDFTMLIEENLYPYMYELIEKRNFGEYNRNFEFLIELFLTIRENDYEEKSEFLNFMEDKLYEVLKLTENLPSLPNLNIKILSDENYIKLSNSFYISLNREKEKKILDLAGKLSMNTIQTSYTKKIIKFVCHILDKI